MAWHMLRRWLAAFAVLLSLVGAAAAGQLEDYKSQGVVGERPDGYLGVVSRSAPADVVQFVNSVNAKRRQSYADIGAQRGVDVDAVAVIAGQKLVERSPPGTFVMDASGRWTKK